MRTIETLDWHFDTAVSVLPVSLTFMGMVCLNNWFLMWSSVGFYAIAKSFTIPMSVTMTFFVLGQRSSTQTVAACLVVTAGVFVGSYYNVELSWFGMSLGVLSSLFTAGYQIAVKRGMMVLAGDQWKMSFYNSVWVVLLLTPVAVLSGEGATAYAALVKNGSLDWQLLGALSFTGVVGFLIGQATYMSIHYTSALAHHVTGAVKSCIQTGAGILLFGETATASGVSGLALSMLGSFMFLRSRMEAAKPPPQREAQV